MKPLLLLFSLSALASSGLAQDAAGLATPHITVTGTAVTEVTPDRLLWSLTLKNTGAALPKVADSHATLLGGLLESLKELGIEPTAVQTSRMEFGENRVYRNQSHVKEGYYASTNVSFKLADLGKYKDVWLRLATINELSVTNVSYNHSKSIELRKETRKKALLAAKEKAAVMAETLDTKIGAVLSIREEAAPSPLYGGNRMITSNVVTSPVFGAGGEDGATLAPGTIPIRCQVEVTFQLQSAAK